MDKLNLLGLGSNDMLNSSLVKSIKEQDVKIQIDPIENKIETLDVKFSRVGDLKTQTGILSEVVDTLGRELTYLDVNAFTSTQGVAWVNAESGVKPQSFTIDVTQKARSDLYQSNKIVGSDAPINTLAETISYTVAGGPQVVLDIPANSTMQDIASIINQTGDMTASVLKVSDTEYRLSIKGVDEGAANNIVFTSVGVELEAQLGLTDPLNHKQTAQNALFTYNGVEMERGTNNVNDIIYGVSIELAGLGTVDVDIEPNYENVVNNMIAFVDLYNETQALVKSNINGTEENDGMFRSNREIVGIMREINKDLFNVDYFNNDNPLKSMVDVGFEKLENGELRFDDSKIGDLMINNFKDITSLFSNSDNGIFKKLSETLDSMTNISNSGSLDELSKKLGREDKRLEEKLERTQARLDVQYRIMEERFAAFDALMGTMNSGFSSLQLQIQQSTASPNG